MRRLRIFASVVIVILLFSAAPRQVEAEQLVKCEASCAWHAMYDCMPRYDYDFVACGIYYGACVVACGA